MGRDFRGPWESSTVANLGDGILLSAGPLLGATITREPIAAAPAVFLQQLPWLVLRIPAGAGAWSGRSSPGSSRSCPGDRAVWFGVIGSGVLLIVIWRTLADIADTPVAAGEDTGCGDSGR